MSLPNRLKSARLDNSTQANLIDDRLGDLEKALCDLFTIPIDTDISAPLATVVAGGLVALFIRNGGIDPTILGELRLNGTALKYFDGSVARTIARAGDILNFGTVQFFNDISTTSTSYVTFAGLTANINTVGGAVLAFFTGPAHAIGNDGYFAISQDGVDSNVLARMTAGGQANQQTCIVSLFNPLAGAHAYALRGKVDSGGNLFANFGSAANGLLIVIEMVK